MKCIYACNQPGPAIESIPEIWILLVFGAIVAVGIYLCGLPAVKTERELRNERLKTQPSTRPGWSLEENRARVLAHLAHEARVSHTRDLEAAAAEFSLNPELVHEHEQELVA